MAVGRRAKAILALGNEKWEMRDKMEIKEKTFPTISLLELITFVHFMCFHASLSFKQGLVYSHFADDIVNGHSEVSEMVEKWGLMIYAQSFLPTVQDVGTRVYYTSGGVAAI